MDRDGAATLATMAQSEGEDRRFSLKLLAEYAYGKPTQPLSGDADAPGISIVVRYEDAGPTQAAPDTD